MEPMPLLKRISTRSIEVGELADLVVLGADPTQVDPMTIKDIPVDITIVGGVTVYEA